MDWDQFDLNPKVIAALKKADIKSIKEILNFSGADLQRLMKLSSADIQCLLKTVSHTLRRDSVLTALQIYEDKDHLTSQHQKLSLGCSVLDNLLKGGIPLVGITELAGESSAGKTQISLQLCLCVQYPYKYGGLESGGWQQTKKIGQPLPQGYLSAILRMSVMASRMLAAFILYAHIRNGIYRYMEVASGNETFSPWRASVGMDHWVEMFRMFHIAQHISCQAVLAASTALEERSSLNWLTNCGRAVYICTEDVFPSKRLQQLIEQQHRLRADVPAEIIQKIRFGNSIFVEHAADLDTFHKCITKRISVLLARGMVRLVVIDSIAALFRCEFGASDSVTKAQYLQTFGAQLHTLSTRFRTPIMCINQVTDAVSESEAAECSCSAVDKRVCPSLGITWANQLLMRLMVSRIPQPEQSSGVVSHPTGSVRTLQVVFAPHLPPSFCYYTVKREGVKGIK